MRIILIVVVCAIFAQTTLFSQETQENKEDKFGTWVLIAGSNKISDKLSVPIIGLLAEHELFNRFEFGFFRTGLTYKFSPKFQGTLGYAYCQLEPYLEDPNTTKEYHQNIVYAEATLKPGYKRISLAHRYRLENRWIGNKNGSQLKLRIRYRLKVNFPIYKKTYASLYNEIFINLQDNPFNQNRLSLSLGYKVTPSLNVELGYLKSHFPKGKYDYLRLALGFKTDWRKKSP